MASLVREKSTLLDIDFYNGAEWSTFVLDYSVITWKNNIGSSRYWWHWDREADGGCVCWLVHHLHCGGAGGLLYKPPLLGEGDSGVSAAVPCDVHLCGPLPHLLLGSVQHCCPAQCCCGCVPWGHDSLFWIFICQNIKYIYLVINFGTIIMPLSKYSTIQLTVV